MIEKEFNTSRLYSRIIHYYIDKKRYSKEKANRIAQSVIKREVAKRICKNPDCGHLYEDHLRNNETCLMLDCDCARFVKAVAAGRAVHP